MADSKGTRSQDDSTTAHEWRDLWLSSGVVCESCGLMPVHEDGHTAPCNEAFQPDARYEVSRLLVKLSETVESVPDPFRNGPISILDINGNQVGSALVVRRV